MTTAPDILLFQTKKVYWLPNLLFLLGAKNTELNRALLWAHWTWEGGNGGPDGGAHGPKFNWLCATTPALGSTRFFPDPNAPNVQVYPTYLIGLNATRKTFLKPEYTAYRDALRSGQPLDDKWDYSLRRSLSVWVSGRADTWTGREYAERVLDTAWRLVD